MTQKGITYIQTQGFIFSCSVSTLGTIFMGAQTDARRNTQGSVCAMRGNGIATKCEFHAKKVLTQNDTPVEILGWDVIE